MSNHKSVKLYIIEPEKALATRLRTELKSLGQVAVVQDFQAAKAASGGLDAIFVSLMSAKEWGVMPLDPALHKTRVVRMPEYEVQRGRPQFAIPGIALSDSEVLSPKQTTRLILHESFKAIQYFNETNSIELKSVGAAAASLGLERLNHGDARDILREAFTILIERPIAVQAKSVHVHH
jgi:hypothetical protein